MFTTEEDTTPQSEPPINIDEDIAIEMECPMFMQEENPNQKLGLKDNHSSPSWFHLLFIILRIQLLVAFVLHDVHIAFRS